MKYNFQRFDGIIQKGDTKIGINKSGLIRLSAGFCRITKAKEFNYSVLFYDSTNKAIAIKLTNQTELGVFSLTKDKAAATISGKSFFAANNINLKKNFGRYEWKKTIVTEIGEVYIIHLK